MAILTIASIAQPSSLKIDEWILFAHSNGVWEYLRNCKVFNPLITGCDVLDVDYDVEKKKLIFATSRMFLSLNRVSLELTCLFEAKEGQKIEAIAHDWTIRLCITFYSYQQFFQ